MATPPSSPPSVTELPPAPNSATDSPSVFDTKANNTVAAQVQMVPQINTANQWLESTAQEVYDNALEAAQSVTDSQTQADRSEEEADRSELYANFSQQAANFLGNWADLTGSALRGNVVVDNSIRWQAAVDIPDITASQPSGLNSDWIILSDQNVVLTGGTYNISNPAGLPDGHKVNFVRAKGVTNAVVANTFGNFKTDLGDYDQVNVGSNYGFTATIYNGNWEI